MPTLVVKYVACLLAVGSGLPAGPEAPMIHLGAMVGRQVSAHDSFIVTIGGYLPWVERIFEKYRNEKDARDFVTAGTAAGVASAFGAPVGGVLFALEEISSSWSPSLTWKVFLTSMVAASVTCMIISAHAMAEDHLAFIGTIQRSSIEFYQGETSSNNLFVLLPATVIGLVAGVIAAGFTGANLYLIGLRKKYVMKATWRRILEPVVVMLVMVVCTVGFSAVWGCTENSFADPRIADRLVGLHCPDGHYNEVATLLYNAGGEVIKILWSRHDETGAGRHTFGAPALLILLSVYVPLACWTAGSIVPTGLIVPVILTGAVIGRLVGLLAVLTVGSPMGDADCDALVDPPDSCITGWNWVDPGAFAIYGSAAFFGGISRLHLTIPVIFMEISGQTRLLLPIMLACKVASVTADYLHPHSLFHAIIEFKGLTFLAAEAPSDRTHELDRQMVKQILIGKPQTLTSKDATIGTVVGVIEKGIEARGINNDVIYPVIDGEGRFEGTISLIHVIKVIEATLDGKELEQRPLEICEVVQGSKTKDMCVGEAEAIITRCRTVAGALEAPLTLGPFINTSSYTVRDNMSILRAYSLFRSMGCRTMVVTDIGNQVVGMLARHDLVDVCHPPHHGHDHAPTPAPAAPPAGGSGREALLPQ
jgi:chloride channel 7